MVLPGSVMRDHLGLGALERIGMDHIEPDQIETETRVEIVMQPGDALGEQAGDHAGIAQGPCRLHAEMTDMAIDPEQLEPAAADAETAALKRLDDAFSKCSDNVADLVLVGDRLGEAALGGELSHRHDRRDRFGLAAQSLIEPLHQPCTETGGERRARQAGNAADGLEPDPPKRGDQSPTAGAGR
jgi:hypothetical protein